LGSIPFFVGFACVFYSNALSGFESWGCSRAAAVYAGAIHESTVCGDVQEEQGGRLIAAPYESVA